MIDKLETKVEGDTLNYKILWKNLSESYLDIAIFTYVEIIQKFLQVFKQIFEKTVHISHYKMMGIDSETANAENIIPNEEDNS